MKLLLINLLWGLTTAVDYSLPHSSDNPVSDHANIEAVKTDTAGYSQIDTSGTISSRSTSATSRYTPPQNDSSTITQTPNRANSLSYDTFDKNGSYCQSMVTVWSSQRSAWYDYVAHNNTSAWLAISPNATFGIGYFSDTIHVESVFSSTSYGPVYTRSDGALTIGEPIFSTTWTVNVTNAGQLYTLTRTTTPWPPSWACLHCEVPCTIYAPKVQLIYFPVSANNGSVTPKPSGYPVTAIERNHTFTSPSAYLSFESLYALDNCRNVSDFYRQPNGNGDMGYNLKNFKGKLYTDYIAAFDPVKISSVIALSGDLDHMRWNITTKPFNFANLNKPYASSVWFEVHPTSIYPNQPYIGDQIKPNIALPDELRNVDPSWQNCAINAVGAWDPPYALQTVQAISSPMPAQPGGALQLPPKETGRPTRTATSSPTNGPGAIPPDSLMSLGISEASTDGSGEYDPLPIQEGESTSSGRGADGHLDGISDPPDGFSNPSESNISPIDPPIPLPGSPSSSHAKAGQADAPILSFSGFILRPVPGRGFEIESQTLIPGGSPITVGSRTIQLISSSLIVNGIPRSLPPIDHPSTSQFIVSEHGFMIESDNRDNIIVDGQLLVPAGQPVTINGMMFIPDTNGKTTFVGSSTLNLSGKAPSTPVASQQATSSAPPKITAPAKVIASPKKGVAPSAMPSPQWSFNFLGALCLMWFTSYSTGVL